MSRNDAYVRRGESRPAQPHVFVCTGEVTTSGSVIFDVVNRARLDRDIAWPSAAIDKELVQVFVEDFIHVVAADSSRVLLALERMRYSDMS